MGKHVLVCGVCEGFQALKPWNPQEYALKTFGIHEYACKTIGVLKHACESETLQASSFASQQLWGWRLGLYRYDGWDYISMTVETTS